MNSIVKISLKAWSIILIIITLITLSIRYQFFGEKFFIDSLLILQAERFGSLYVDGFSSAATFFRYINLIDVDTLFGWSIYISVLSFFINLYILKDEKTISLGKLLFIITGMSLWYLFAVGITKEVPQTLFYVMIYYFCCKNNIIKSMNVKVTIGALILAVSAYIFRPYYILTSFFTIIVFLIMIKVGHNNRVLRVTALCMLSVLVFLVVTKIVLPDKANMILTLRSGSYQYLAGNTDSLINDVFENSSNNLIVYMVNYFVNATRLMAPVELLAIGKVYYLPFLIYQFVFSYNYFKNIKESNINNESFLSIVFITSFIMVSVIMEPDFGSWARHQSVCWILSKNLLK